jgi:3-hydroxyacyl-[acyl-carrier-protein] dehydratase
VDRIVECESGHAIDTIKNVSATEDVFDDHFPGCPIFPGALIIGVFEQSTELMIAMADAFTTIGRLERISRATFRHFVRPGDQLRVRCERTGEDPRRWGVRATAHVGDELVADAMLEFAVEEVAARGDRASQLERLEALVRELGTTPLGLAGFSG